MDDSLTLEVRNLREAIDPASDAAEAWLLKIDASPDALYLVRLAIEELVLNCIKYGYDDAAEHTIVIKLSVTGETLTITVIDDGHPFDPLTAPPPDLSVDLLDRPIGGLGLHMLRELADHLSYRRCNNTNQLTITKRM